ncbi:MULTISPECIES: LysE family translocator [Bacillus]|uniref:LysE family translocator n=1 Tax=Bacillus TaxID=1386 RepID=UPI000D014BD3|nr:MULTISPECIES: LysE family translocator [Bacillus]MDR0124599.1 LysE family translocator [Bacillus zhangzhouensis]PRO41030.1 lysine transporter LysE [Bacillus sp. LLTC93]
MNDFLTFLLLTLFVVASPGVDFALITKRTIGTGKSDGIKMALGLTSGALIHTLAAAFGLSLILMKSALAFEIIKYLGAIYLIYLGVSSFMNKKEKEAAPPHKVETPKHSAFKQGLISNTLNPKVAIFFLTFLPQFVTPGLNTSFQFVVMGSIYALLSILWFSTIVLLLGYIRKFLLSAKVQTTIDRITGLVLVGFGVKLLFTNPKH